MPLLGLGTDNRMNGNTIRPLYEEHIEKIINSSSQQDRIFRICTVNLELELLKKKWNVRNHLDLKLCGYLEGEWKTHFHNVSYRMLRNNSEIILESDYNSDRRSTNFLWVLVHDVYYDFLNKAKKLYGLYVRNNYMKKSKRAMNYVDIFILHWVTFVSFPIYLLSKFISIAMPLFIVLYLYVSGNGIVLFLDVDTFQVTMWCLYVFMIIVWFCLSFVVVQREYILWHLQPTNNQLWSASEHIKDDMMIWLSAGIQERYAQRAMVIHLRSIFSNDLCDVIMEYLYCVEIKHK